MWKKLVFRRRALVFHAVARENLERRAENQFREIPLFRERIILHFRSRT